MIHIRKNLLNKIGLTLRELSIEGEPEEYLLNFVSENSKDVTCSIITVPVSSTNRLQVFEFTEGTDITFENTGFYSYDVYQTTSNNFVETGLVRVIGEDEVVQEHISTVIQQVYNG